MKPWDYEAVTYGGDVYCLTCLPKNADQDEVYPIFADSEWDYFPSCAHCGWTHEYMTKIIQLEEADRKTYRKGGVEQ